jgi:hypothetical protein
VSDGVHVLGLAVLSAYVVLGRVCACECWGVCSGEGGEGGRGPCVCVCACVCVRVCVRAGVRVHWKFSACGSELGRACCWSVLRACTWMCTHACNAGVAWVRMVEVLLLVQAVLWKCSRSLACTCCCMDGLHGLPIVLVLDHLGSSEGFGWQWQLAIATGCDPLRTEAFQTAVS